MTPPRFEPLGKARFRTEFADTGERIVIPAGRNWFAMPFIAVWLTLWTFGGIAAVTTLLATPEVAFVALWLVGWAFGPAVNVDELRGTPKYTYNLFGKPEKVGVRVRNNGGSVNNYTVVALCATSS